MRQGASADKLQSRATTYPTPSLLLVPAMLTRAHSLPTLTVKKRSKIPTWSLSCVRLCAWGRNGFSDVLRILDQVISNLRQLAPHDDVDINNVTLRYALDVTGLVGFAKDFGTARSFSDAGTDELFTIIQDCE